MSAPSTTPDAAPEQDLRERLTRVRLHPEIEERLIPHLREIADRMEPSYRRELREKTEYQDAGPIFLSNDRACLREAADELEVFRKLTREAADHLSLTTEKSHG